MSSSNSASKSAWQSFYDAERHWLKWVDEQFDVLACFSPDILYKPFELNNGTITWYKPPKYIRRIVQAPSVAVYEEAHNRFEEVLSYYQKAMESGKHTAKRYPARFPEFLDPLAYQLTYDIQDAFESVAVKPDEWVAVKRFFLAEDPQDDHSAIWLSEVQSVFPSAKLMTDALGLKAEIVVDSNEIYAFSNGATHIQRRLATGKKYTGMFSYANDERRRVKLGFFIVGPEHDIAIYKTIPRKKRSDALRDDQLIALPFSTDYLFYRKK
ncbi:hypothetical protein [Vibrio sp. 10N]|uniref:hypothetical protein n=1 Tax=Vibrio sp. 10N TaxID=3058938 RepID=UPI002812AB4A|nr:hypothetical protein VB10N_46470 [Vibrio sp. 10N]